MLADKVFRGEPINKLLKHVDTLTDDQAVSECISMCDLAIEKVKLGSSDTDKAFKIIRLFEKTPQDKMDVIRMLVMLEGK